jgi:hypothetical protein
LCITLFERRNTPPRNGRARRWRRFFLTLTNPAIVGRYPSPILMMYSSVLVLRIRILFSRTVL